ncbi:hypothetical protein [Paenibacillus massiliensis]|uniref:hypothetical protein n=1 Tax=Paenibacillus massiliensis TaxID=225917 RepID=UPI00037EC09D|nr:hypothetical protein [Paenibacillus massiliensis]
MMHHKTLNILDGQGEISTLAFADSAPLSSSVLMIQDAAGHSIAGSSDKGVIPVDPHQHLLESRKTVVVMEYSREAASPDWAEMAYGCEIGIHQYQLELPPDCHFILGEVDGLEEELAIRWEGMPAGQHQIRIGHYMKTPRIAEGELTSEQSELVKYAQVITIYIHVSPFDAEQDAGLYSKSQHIFDSYGSSGFILADLPRMRERVRQELGEGKLDLLNAFGEGDLADRLMEEGVMSIVWGLTPWCYSIFGMSDKNLTARLPLEGLPVQTGIYRIAADLKHLSVIPVNALRNWEECAELTWPELLIEGAGSTLRLELYLTQCQSMNGLHESPLPYFLARRSEQQTNTIVPLVQVDILEEAEV